METKHINNFMTVIVNDLHLNSSSKGCVVKLLQGICVFRKAGFGL